MHKIEDKLTQVNFRLQDAACRANRNPQAVTLLAVSKGQPAENIHRAYRAGQHQFGENYLQEALVKIHQLADLDIVWHFIGPVQSNKTRDLAQNFNWVHTVDRIKIAQRLSQQRPPEMAPLNICIQINIDDESGKSGVKAEHIEELALSIASLPNLRLRGLMIIPAVETLNDSPDPFQRTAAIYTKLKQLPQLSHLDTLSMGMSADMEQAIEAGATIVRVGTAIFGPRQ